MSGVAQAVDAAEPCFAPHRAELIEIAKASIDAGLRAGVAHVPELATVSAALRRERAAFVTLTRYGVLRGCVGTLQPCRALAEEVAVNACAAAFRDPRFPPLAAHERAGLAVKLEILGEAEPIAAPSEAAVIEQLRPGIDGVVLEAGEDSATFLPTVWAQLPQPARFWQALKRKAGLPDGPVDAPMRVYRYTTEVVSEISEVGELPEYGGERDEGER